MECSSENINSIYSSLVATNNHLVSGDPMLFSCILGTVYKCYTDTHSGKASIQLK